MSERASAPPGVDPSWWSGALERAAEVAHNQIDPYDTWNYLTPQELAEDMLTAALNVFPPNAERLGKGS